MDTLLEAGPFEARSGEDRVLFTGATVRLRAEELVVLEGPSGAGKTTLLRMVAGLEAVAARRSLEGESFEGPQLPGWRSRVTLLAQDAPVLPGSLEDNLRFPFLQREGRGRAYPEGRVAELVERAGIGSIPRDRRAEELSGGERHRLALVRGLAWDPVVLLADEPLAGVDSAASDACWELLEEFASRRGRAVVCTLHDPARSAAADRRIRLADGRLEDA